LRVFLGTLGEKRDRVELFLLNFSPDFSPVSFLSSCSFLIKAFATLIGFRPNFGDICDSFDSFDASFDFFSVAGAFSGTFGDAFAALLVFVVAVVVDGSMEADGCVVGMEEFSFGAELVEVVRCGGGGGFAAPGGEVAGAAVDAAAIGAGMHAFAVGSLLVLLNLARLAFGVSPFASLLSISFCTFCVVEGCGGGGGAGRVCSTSDAAARRPLTDTYFNLVPAVCCPLSDFAFVAVCCFCGRKLGGRILVVSTDRTAFPRVLSVVDAAFCRCRDFILEFTSESPFWFRKVVDSFVLEVAEGRLLELTLSVTKLVDFDFFGSSGGMSCRTRSEESREVVRCGGSGAGVVFGRVFVAPFGSCFGSALTDFLAFDKEPEAGRVEEMRVEKLFDWARREGGALSFVSALPAVEQLEVLEELELVDLGLCCFCLAGTRSGIVLTG
jgi:hypothetical protein